MTSDHAKDPCVEPVQPPRAIPLEAPEARKASLSHLPVARETTTAIDVNPFVPLRAREVQPTRPSCQRCKDHLRGGGERAKWHNLYSDMSLESEPQLIEGTEHHRPPERSTNQKRPVELHVGNMLLRSVITSSSGGTTYFST